MINRNLSRRLERLEALVIPTGPPHVIQIVFVSPNGEDELGPRLRSRRLRLARRAGGAGTGSLYNCR